MHKILGFTVALAIACACFLAPTTSDAAPTPKTALVYGDSLTWESRLHMTQHMAKKSGWNMAVRSFPGTSVCTWNEWLAADLATHRPSIVALATAANRFNPSFPCMVDGSGNPLQGGTQAFIDKIAEDLDAFFSTVTATGARVLFVSAPPMSDPVRDADIKKVNAIAKVLAGRYPGVSISGAARTALSKSGKYTATKPCLATETAAMGCDLVTNQIAVRTVVGAQTGLHFCPGGLPSEYPWDCATYSSGEYRWAKAEVNAIVKPPKPILPIAP